MYKTCCQKEQVSKLGRDDPGLNLNQVPDQMLFLHISLWILRLPMLIAIYIINKLIVG